LPAEGIPGINKLIKQSIINLERLSAKRSECKIDSHSGQPLQATFLVHAKQPVVNLRDEGSPRPAFRAGKHCQFKTKLNTIPMKQKIRGVIAHPNHSELQIWEMCLNRPLEVLQMCKFHCLLACEWLPLQHAIGRVN